MRVKLCLGNTVVGYLKMPVTNEVEIPSVLRFGIRDYRVTHRRTIAPNLLGVIVEPIGVIPSPVRTVWFKFKYQLRRLICWIYDATTKWEG